MHKILPAIGLLISLTCFTQDSPRNKSTPLQIVSPDSTGGLDSLQKAELQRSTERGINYFSELQEQRKKEEKKKAILYIVMGGAFLVVLIIGLKRRVKK